MKTEFSLKSVNFTIKLSLQQVEQIMGIESIYL